MLRKIFSLAVYITPALSFLFFITCTSDKNSCISSAYGASRISLKTRALLPEDPRPSKRIKLLPLVTTLVDQAIEYLNHYNKIDITSPPFATGTFHHHPSSLFAVSPLSARNLGIWLTENAKYVGPLITKDDLNTANEEENCFLLSSLVNYIDISLLSEDVNLTKRCLYNIFSTRESINEMPNESLLPVFFKTKMHGEAFMVNFLFDKIIEHVPALKKREGMSTLAWSSLGLHMIISKIIHTIPSLTKSPENKKKLELALHNLKTIHMTSAKYSGLTIDRKLEYINNLQIGEIVSFHCGFDRYDNDDGHSMIVMITRIANNEETGRSRFVARIINGGYGLEKNPRIISTNGKIVIAAIIESQPLTLYDLACRQCFAYIPSDIEKKAEIYYNHSSANDNDNDKKRS